MYDLFNYKLDDVVQKSVYSRAKGGRRHLLPEMNESFLWPLHYTSLLKRLHTQEPSQPITSRTLNKSISLLEPYVLNSHCQTFPYQTPLWAARWQCSDSHWGRGAQLDPGCQAFAADLLRISCGAWIGWVSSFWLLFWFPNIPLPIRATKL